MLYKNKNFQVKLETIGFIFLLTGFFAGIATYLTGLQFVYYFSTSIILLSLFYMLYAIQRDIDTVIKFPAISFAFIFVLTIVYFSQRTIPLEFSLMTGDASDYLWSGVSSFLQGNDIGFFPPLTSSISAMGYQLFGLKHIPMMTSLIYFSSVTLFYFLFRKLGLNVILSYVFILLFQFIPLNIWLSKTTFSEPVWQVLILIFIVFSYSLINKKTFTWIDLFPLFIMLLLAPLSRGSAVILYGGIAFLSFYHYWRYGNFKLAVVLLLGMLVLTISMHYSLNIRTRYLVEWQYKRVIPSITVNELLIVFYTIPFLSMGILYILRWYKIKFKQIDFPLLLVIFSIFFKISVALYFSMTKELDFFHLVYLNEFGLAEGNFGFLITILIILGLLYMHYGAAKENELLLIFVVIYALFSVPFTMQNISFNHTHEMLLYWNRYYFSEIFIIHFFAWGSLLKLLYEIFQKSGLSDKSKLFLLVPMLVGMFFYSMNIKLHQFVSSEGYLEGSSEIFTWISERTRGKKISVVYSDKIYYGDSDIRKLLHKGLYIMGNSIKSYQKVPEHRLTRRLHYRPHISKSQLLLCLTASSCDLDRERFTMIDNSSFPIRWRKHTKDIVTSVNKNIIIHAYLYKIKQYFKANEKVIMTNLSDIAPTLLGKGWHPMEKDGVWSGKEAEIFIPKVWSTKNISYELKLELGFFDASVMKPKKLYISIGDQILLEKTVNDSKRMIYRVKLPEELLDDDKEMLRVIVKIPNASSSRLRSSFKQIPQKGILLSSLEVVGN